jgi:hypothetical protein
MYASRRYPEDTGADRLASGWWQEKLEILPLSSLAEISMGLRREFEAPAPEPNRADALTGGYLGRLAAL